MHALHLPLAAKVRLGPDIPGGVGMADVSGSRGGGISRTRSLVSPGTSQHQGFNDI